MQSADRRLWTRPRLSAPCLHPARPRLCLTAPPSSRSLDHTSTNTQIDVSRRLDCWTGSDSRHAEHHQQAAHALYYPSWKAAAVSFADIMLSGIDAWFSHKWQLIQIQLNHPTLRGRVEAVAIMESAVSSVFTIHFLSLTIACSERYWCGG